jgi:hypothetical protein
MALRIVQGRNDEAQIKASSRKRQEEVDMRNM